jgi:hypothetical protein
LISGVAAILGLIVGFCLGAVGVASIYGEMLTFGQGIVLTVLMIAWSAATAFAIAGEERDA